MRHSLGRPQQRLHLHRTCLCTSGLVDFGCNGFWLQPPVISSTAVAPPFSTGSPAKRVIAAAQAGPTYNNGTLLLQPLHQGVIIVSYAVLEQPGTLKCSITHNT